MTNSISESDWKLFRQLRSVALERFCQRVLSEIEQLAADNTKSNHDRYLAIYKLMMRRDKELATAFNDLRRSTALFQLVQIQSHDLLTEEEMGRFGPETRAVVQFLLGNREE